MRRIYLDNVERKGKFLNIYGDTFFYLSKVLKMKKGEEFLGFDGSGKEYILKVNEIGKDFLRGEIINSKEVFDTECKVEIILCQSLPKFKKMDIIVNWATQLGVKKIVPVISERVITRFEKEKGKKKVERWRRVAIEASKVSGRVFIPEIYPVTKFEDALKMKSDFSIIFWEGEKRPLKDILNYIPKKSPLTIKIFIGPEGGYSEKEVEMAKNNGFFSASLGRRILKVETASIISVGILLFHLGDL